MKTGSGTGFQSKVLENPEHSGSNQFQIFENWFWNWLIQQSTRNVTGAKWRRNILGRSDPWEFDPKLSFFLTFGRALIVLFQTAFGSENLLAKARAFYSCKMGKFCRLSEIQNMFTSAIQMIAHFRKLSGRLSTTNLAHLPLNFGGFPHILSGPLKNSPPVRKLALLSHLSHIEVFQSAITHPEMDF